MAVEKLVSPQNLKKYLYDLYRKIGLSEQDSAFIATSTVETNLWGIDSHGVMRVPIYVRRLISGAMNKSPNMRILKESNALTVLDGDNACGYIVGREAMNLAIDKANRYGVGVVGAINSNHFGATGIYTRLAVDNEMIGIAMTTSPPYIAFGGSRKPIVGNNPIAIGIPTFGRFPILLDIAMSVVAGGKLLVARAKGEKIPLDWATDSEGHPTDDPEKAFKGYFLPLGGHKGFGLALIVEILCGVITSGCFLDQQRGMYKNPDDPSLTGHLMIAMNIESIMAKEEMKRRMALFIEMVKSTPMNEGSNELLVPGEIEYKTKMKREVSGIPIPVQLYEELLALGKNIGIATDLELLETN